MDDNIKSIVNRHIGRGLEKMKEWDSPTDHTIASFKRSMRFLAKDIVDELSGQLQPEVDFNKYESDM